MQGSNMARSNKGMRTGISLVEMLIAVILFGVISAIGYKYYKNFYDVGLAAKKVRVSAIIDQATQLSNAYDLYTMQIGASPVTVAELFDPAVKILTQIPTAIPSMTSTGWQLASPAVGAVLPGLALNDATNDDIAFIYSINVPALAKDSRDYCNILNNIEDTTWSFDALDAAILTDTGMYGAGFKDIMCYQTAADTYHYAFIKTVTQ